jgi:hypothetical protein
MIKTCNDKYGYGCTNQIEYNNDDELASMFYKKHEWYLNTCKECHRKRTLKMYHDGTYTCGKTLKRKFVDKETYGVLNIGGTNGDNDSE